MSGLTFQVRRREHRGLHQQSGAILIMFTIGLFALLAVAALAIDGSHLLLSKGRLQNVADAAALSAAKELQDGGSLIDARVAALAIISQNLAFSQNRELEQGVAIAAPDYNNTQVTTKIAVEFSSGPDPFEPSLFGDEEYVRVRITNVTLDNFLADVLGFDKKVRASAVAGRSTDIECNSKLVPMMVCAEEVRDDEGNITGYTAPPALELYVMKTSSQQNHSIGPGNFQLLDLGVSPSDTTLKEALAGGYSPGVCVYPGDFVATKPGNNVGPVAAGLNTRLGVPTAGQNGLSADDYPSDVNTCQGTYIEESDIDDQNNISPDAAAGAYRFASYDGSLTDPLSDQCDTVAPDYYSGMGGRREMEVVIGICDGETNGTNDIEVVDTGCFFLTQTVSHKGNEAYVIGEFSASCSGAGSASLDPTFVSDSSKIVLYRDPDSPDS